MSDKDEGTHIAGMSEASSALTSAAAAPTSAAAAPLRSSRGMGPFVHIDPHDDLSAILRVIREEDPAVWRPKAEVVDRWGVLEGGDQQETGPDWRNGKMKSWRLPKTGRRSGTSRIMQLRCTCLSWIPPSGERFKVSGGIVLNTLADKVLMPITGWVRNYHGYVFCDRREGACFVPKDSNAIDMMHVNFSYFYLMDDKKYKLGDLLTEKGARLGWTYDIGDMWRHELEVENILSPEESTAPAKCWKAAGGAPRKMVTATSGTTRRCRF